LSLTVGDINGRIIGGTASVMYHVTEHFDLAAGYTGLNFKVTAVKPKAEGMFKWGYNGPSLTPAIHSEKNIGRIKGLVADDGIFTLHEPATYYFGFVARAIGTTSTNSSAFTYRSQLFVFLEMRRLDMQLVSFHICINFKYRDVSGICPFIHRI
jgi:hypothetical protein